jgi:signal transduction histidine kinase
LRDTIWAIDKGELNIQEVDYKIRNLFWRYGTEDMAIPLEINIPPELYCVQLSTHQAVNIVRIIQEAVSNSIKHSAACVISIGFSQTVDGELRITIRDNGKGFQVLEHAEEGHYGLQNMKKRAQDIGSAFTIESNSSGTTITLDVCPTTESIIATNP